jgi:hypothetical protein
LTEGGDDKKEGKGNPHPNRQTRKGGARFLFGLGSGQLMLATPTIGFIFRIPRVTIRAVHLFLSLHVAIAEW